MPKYLVEIARVTPISVEAKKKEDAKAQALEVLRMNPNAYSEVRYKIRRDRK